MSGSQESAPTTDGVADKEQDSVKNSSDEVMIKPPPAGIPTTGPYTGTKCGLETPGDCLMEKRIGVYAMVGKFPTYVGKIEGKGKKGCKPIRKYGEHGTWSRTYCNRFWGRRRQNLRSCHRYGSRPCFPRTLAMAGHHNASMVLLQNCNTYDVNSEEHRWEKVLGPCSNAIAPYRDHNMLIGSLVARSKIPMRGP